MPFGDDVVALVRSVERQRQGRIAVLEHDRDRCRLLVSPCGKADGDAAEGGERQIERHAHTAHRAVQDNALAMQIDDTPMFVGFRIRGFETHWQGERVEPRCAARPGSEPAGFHFDASKLKLPAGCCRPLSRECPTAVAIGLTTLVNRRYSLPERPA